MMDAVCMFTCGHPGNIMNELIETIGTPEFYVTKIGKTEPAGGGCVRVFLCIERGNTLLTQFTVVMPALSLIAACRQAEAAALNAFNEIQMVVGAAH